MHAAVEQTGFEILLQKILDERGLDFRAYRPETLLRRLARRLGARGCDSLEAYLRILDREPEEYALLLADFTIKYSYFFRDPHVFDALRDRVLPLILVGGKAPKIWSTGCAEGEELYSLAILLAQALGEQLAHRRPLLVGTDIDEAALSNARRGVYREQSLERVSPEILEAFFETHARDRWRVLHDLRGLTRFHRYDLVTDSGDREFTSPETASFDLVLLRNTLIYFERPLQERVLEHCVKRIAPGGFLVLGTGETLTGKAAGSLEHFDRDSKIFRLA